MPKVTQLVSGGAGILTSGSISLPKELPAFIIKSNIHDSPEKTLSLMPAAFQFLELVHLRPLILHCTPGRPGRIFFYFSL